MEYLIVSYTHKNTDIKTREKLSFGNDLEKESFLSKIIEHKNINEVILISTCNRVEFIVSVSEGKESSKFIIEQLSLRSDIVLSDLLARADMYENEAAIHHLFTVASSLDSLVVGETQIAGQLKDAYKFSLDKEFCSSKLSRIIQYSFKCAARVRSATSLGTGSVSVASTAVSKAKELYKDEDGIEAIVIGAGEMSELAIKHLLKSDFKVIICSRNIQKAKILASKFEENIDIQSYSELESLLNTKRLLVTATSAPYPIIKEAMIKKCSFRRNWFDIAVPRDIDDMNISGVNIFSVDDLQGIVDDNLELRADAAKIAYNIIDNVTTEFFDWIKTLSVEPTIKNLHLKANSVIERKIKNALKKSYIKKDDEENIKKLCETIMNEFLHDASTHLRNISKGVEADMSISNTQNLFKLEDESNSNTKIK